MEELFSLTTVLPVLEPEELFSSFQLHSTEAVTDSAPSHFAVMSALPGATAVITPLLFTVATFSSLEVKVTLASVLGSMV